MEMENWFSPELIALIKELEQPNAYIALLLIAAAFPIAWGVPRLLRGPVPRHGSIVFGGRIFDGVLFPAIWLGLVWMARTFCLHQHLPLAVFKVVVPILLSLLVIRLTVRVMRVAFPKSQIVRAVEKTVSWLAWAGVVLWITGVLPSVIDALDDISWKMGSGKMSLATLLEGVLAAGLVLMITLWISAAIETKLLKGAAGQQLSWRKAAANMVRAVLVFVGLIVTLSAVGIDLTALSVLGGAIGVGLGFGLQKLASNYVSGFVILAERALRIGDTVKVDGFEGRITDIATRYTVLRALNGRESIVPNELLITQRVESATLADPENGTGGVKSDVNLALLRLFNANGIEIPYPQRVVRVMPVEGGLAAEGVIPGVNLDVNPSPNAPTAQEMADAPQGKGQPDALSELTDAPKSTGRGDALADGEPGA